MEPKFRYFSIEFFKLTYAEGDRIEKFKFLQILHERFTTKFSWKQNCEDEESREATVGERDGRGKKSCSQSTVNINLCGGLQTVAECRIMRNVFFTRLVGLSFRLIVLSPVWCFASFHKMKRKKWEVVLKSENWNSEMKRVLLPPLASWLVYSDLFTIQSSWISFGVVFRSQDRTFSYLVDNPHWCKMVSLPAATSYRYTLPMILSSS